MIDLPVVFNLTPKQRETLLNVEVQRGAADTIYFLFYDESNPYYGMTQNDWEKEVQDVVSLLTQKRNPVIIMSHTHWYVMRCLLQMAYGDEDYDVIVRRNLKALCESKFEDKS